MSHGLVKANRRRDALIKLGFSPAIMKKVYGGYAWFDSVREYEIWKRSV